MQSLIVTYAFEADRKPKCKNRIGSRFGAILEAFAFPPCSIPVPRCKINHFLSDGLRHGWCDGCLSALTRAISDLSFGLPTMEAFI